MGVLARNGTAGKRGSHGMAKRPAKRLPSRPMSGGEHRRIAFTLQYDGSAFFGWQLQPDRRSVQGEVERVLSRLFARPARVTGSGRTDRGVHATGQVA